MITLKLNLPTVDTMVSPTTGAPVANQIILSNDDGRTFVSYGTNIAYRPYGSDTVYLDELHWDHSTTTGKYRNQFLNESINETRKKIKSGEYVLEDLNS